jgi:hypothetical protein
MLFNNYTRRETLRRNVALYVGMLAWVGIGVMALVQGEPGKPPGREQPVRLAPTPAAGRTASYETPSR